MTAVEPIRELPLRWPGRLGLVLAPLLLAALGCLITITVAGWGVARDDPAQAHYLSSTRALAGLAGSGHGLWLSLRPVAGVGLLDARVESIRPDLPANGRLDDWSLTCADSQVYAVFGGHGAWTGAPSAALLSWTDGGVQQGAPVPDHPWPYCMLEATTVKGAFVRLYVPLQR